MSQQYQSRPKFQPPIAPTIAEPAIPVYEKPPLETGRRLVWWAALTVLLTVGAGWILVWLKLLGGGAVTWEWAGVFGILPGLAALGGAVWFAVEIARDVLTVKLWYGSQRQDIRLRRRVISAEIRSRKSYDRKWHGAEPAKGSDPPYVLNGNPIPREKPLQSAIPADWFAGEEETKVLDAVPAPRRSISAGIRALFGKQQEPGTAPAPERFVVDVGSDPEADPAQFYTKDMRTIVTYALAASPSFRRIVPGYMTRDRYYAARDPLVSAGVLVPAGQSFALASELLQIYQTRGERSVHLTTLIALRNMARVLADRANE